METKFLSCVDHDVPRASGKYTCVVCCCGVDNHSIQCWQCMLWIHKKWNGITKRLLAHPNYAFGRCSGGAWPIDGMTLTEVYICQGYHAWCGGHFLLPRWYAVLRWGLWQRHCCQILCGLADGPALTSKYPSPWISSRQTRCTRPAFARLCSTVAKHGDQITLNCSDSAAMAVPWSTGSVALNTKMKHPHLRYYVNLYTEVRPVSKLSQTLRLPTLEIKGSIKRHGLNVWRLVSISVAWLALTNKTVMHENQCSTSLAVADVIKWEKDRISV